MKMNAYYHSELRQSCSSQRFCPDAGMLIGWWIRLASLAVCNRSAVTQRPYPRPVGHFQVFIGHDATSSQFAWQYGNERVRGHSSGPNHCFRRNTRPVAQVHHILVYTDNLRINSNLYLALCQFLLSARAAAAVQVFVSFRNISALGKPNCRRVRLPRLPSADEF
jgi:hypothetical protein